PAARVEILRHLPVERELSPAVTLAVGMPANERMDWLVEKATELGAAAVQPLMTSRTVLRLEGERAVRRAAHWQAIAQAACEQCGRNRIPVVHAAAGLEVWLASLPPQAGTVARCVLSAPGQGQALSFAAWVGAAAGWSALTVLSGPEGGLSPEETSLAVRAGFVPVSLGPRVLRAETAPLALLGAWAALSTGS
ncbi:MAG: 16S rRNA (uracil(1498)-N(3))-methyltransferase, partial [Acidobacteriota bacterium]